VVFCDSDLFVVVIVKKMVCVFVTGWIGWIKDRKWRCEEWEEWMYVDGKVGWFYDNFNIMCLSFIWGMWLT
jgi:hypothetical protein